MKLIEDINAIRKICFKCETLALPARNAIGNQKKEELTHETERVTINDQKHSTLISKQTQTDEIERRKKSNQIVLCIHIAITLTLKSILN